MQRDIEVLAAGDRLRPAPGLTGRLFECAPDSGPLAGCAERVDLQGLIGAFDAAKSQAYVLARKLLDREPALRGLRQLRIFEEVVIRELQYAFHVLHLARRLEALDVRTCRFQSESRFSQGLAELSRVAGIGPRVVVPAASARSATARSLANSWRRMAQGRFSGARAREELGQALRRIDPFHRRRALLPAAVRERGGLWFYSTAYTFTQIGLLYEPHFPERFRFLVENPATGGRALGEAGRPFVDVHEFASWPMAPSRREASEAADAVSTHIKALPLQGDDAWARDLFLRSRFFGTFLARLLPQGLFHAALFERWIERTGPEALIVGNPVFEGHALHAARRHGIPTVLLQHGILGDYCQFSDPPVDHYVVRGEFWKEFLAPAARARAVVLNPIAPPPAAGRAVDGPKAVVFVTVPYALQEFFHEIDLDEILDVVAAVAHEGGRELVIRVHPLEQVDHYRARIDALRSRASTGPAVSYSQGPGLDDVLRRAAVAVTYSSTVFLDCLRHRVPIVSFDWHDFSYRKQIERWGVFHFSRDLAHLGRLVGDAVAGRLAPYAREAEPFLAATPDETLRAELASCVRPRAAASSHAAR
jgi:hypothetical protein